MTLVEQLEKLDESVLAALVNPDALDEQWLSEQLQTRAHLLQQLIEQGSVSEHDSAALIQRSRQLKASAEAVKQQLGDKLKSMKKGRRSVQAYQTVKRN
ncbi:hypothetical protein [Oceanimonas baumannii]|uniref:Flagellar protein FliT n=1 Tax=Oceanimonas baumannii TaxID=129578 RepID=A0A235CMW8_9GAMM|nr:hypothetical protein [Oceanimonas baumannii]OYD25902.1 hypothetical protein B6S09_03425 [Oceanimonas baumannii]TDW60081.1 hypothetical protein LY04_01073 [Oceanimonas baumannii]